MQFKSNAVMSIAIIISFVLICATPQALIAKEPSQPSEVIIINGYDNPVLVDFASQKEFNSVYFEGYLPNTDLTQIFIVPTDKVFVVTDVSYYGGANLLKVYQGDLPKIVISEKNDGTNFASEHYNSGYVFDAGSSINIQYANNSGEVWISITGYYLDSY